MVTERILIEGSQRGVSLALTRGNRLIAFHCQDQSSENIVSNIYVGKVKKVVRGIQAAFIDIGGSKDGFLHLKGIDLSRQPKLSRKVDFEGVDIGNYLREGQWLVVQVEKEGFAGKGPRLTTSLSISSNMLVLTPHTNKVGVSRRIEKEGESERFKRIFEPRLHDIDRGLIVRTSAEGASEEKLNQALDSILQRWDVLNTEIQNAINAQNIGLIGRAESFSTRLIMDLASRDLEKVLINDPDLFKEVSHYVTSEEKSFANAVSVEFDGDDIFAKFGVTEQIDLALKKEFQMSSGAQLVFEQTEALVSVDVNSSRKSIEIDPKVGGTDAQEQMAIQVNMEAAELIPGQLRLRNLAGLIVIDFINMSSTEAQDQVLAALEKGLQTDPAATRVDGFSDLGVVQMTRRRSGKSLQASMANLKERKPDSVFEEVCERIVTDIIRHHKINKNSKESGEYLVRAEQKTVDYLLENKANYLSRLESAVKRSVGVQVEPDFDVDEFDFSLVE